MNRLQLDTGHATHYLDRQGLPSNVVQGILKDKLGNLWLSTRSGLSRFNPETGRFRNYDLTDGLQSNEFSGACFRSAKGEMFFGGPNGANSFFPGNIRDNKYLPPVFITRFQKFNEDVPLARDISVLDTLNLTYRDRAIAFEFAALDYTAPKKNKFAYRLEGLNEEWIELGARNYVPFFNLPPKEYTLHVRAANNDGVWNMNGASLKIIIAPPFYQTKWAYAFYVLLIGAVLYHFLRVQQAKLKKERVIAQKLQLANEQLTLADKIKDEFLANTSHELQTPLNGMIGIADALLEGAAGSINPKQAENLSMVVTSGMRLSNLVNDILEFSKLRRKDIDLRLQAVDLYGLTQLVLGLAKPLTQGKDLVLINEIQQNCPAVLGDENRLEQIMHNLVGNAVKFTESGAVRVSAKADGRRLTVSVADSGIGVDPDRRRRIFESFEQADGTISRTHGGTGLGLAITKRLVELHGGTIQVTSVKNQGSTFSFTLPLADEDQAPAKPRSVQPQEFETVLRLSEDFSESNRGRFDPNAEFHLLIVDDEPINLQVLQNFLSARKYAITRATNGPEAIQLLDEGQRFDLILLDVMMPKMSGYEVCRHIRERFRAHELPIIMLTAKNQTGDVITGFEAGANDYVVKPVSKSELMVRIKTHLELLRTSRSLAISKAKLEESNRTLEQKVEERTRQLQEGNRELEALDGIVQSINREFELERVLRTLLREALGLFGQAEKGRFLILDPKNDGFRFAAVAGYEPPDDDMLFSREDLASLLPGADEKNDEPRIVWQADSPTPGFASGWPTPKGSLVMTVTFRDQVEGLLILDSFHGPEAFDRSDIDRLRRLESHALTAVAKARILEEIRQKNHDLVLAQKQLILQEKMAYLGSLIAGIAHEIQNPLNFVNNFSAIARDMTEELREHLAKSDCDSDARSAMLPILDDLKDNTRLIHEHGQRVTRIVHNMMMHSRSGGQERAVIEVNKLVEEQFEMAYHGLVLRGEMLDLKVEKDYDQSIECLEGAPKDIGRAVFNILTNSIDALALRKRAVGNGFNPIIRLKTRMLDETVTIGIRDNGLGVPGDQIPKIFNPFFTTKPEGTGIGLGLSICYDIIVEGHGGQITVESEKDAFTEFTIALPKHR